MCKKNIYRLCNVKRLEQDIKSRCNPHIKCMKTEVIYSTLRVICTCDQCDSVFCAVQLTALIKPTDVFYYIAVLVYIRMR